MSRVGKRLPDGSIYVHESALRGGHSALSPKELLLYAEALNALNDEMDFSFDFVQVFPSQDKVRFMKMNDLWDPHPHVVDSMTVYPDSRTFLKGKPSGQIYHRLETMIDPNHPSYAFHKAVTEWEVEEGLLGKDAPRSIGYPKYWEQWIGEHMPLQTYNESIADLRKVYG